MHSLETLEQAAAASEEALLAYLLPVSAGVADWPRVDLDEAQGRAIAQGQRIVVQGLAPGRAHAAFAADGALLALLEAGTDGRVRILRGFNLPPA